MSPPLKGINTELFRCTLLFLLYKSPDMELNHVSPDVSDPAHSRYATGVNRNAMLRLDSGENLSLILASCCHTAERVRLPYYLPFGDISLKGGSSTQSPLPHLGVTRKEGIEGFIRVNVWYIRWDSNPCLRFCRP